MSFDPLAELDAILARGRTQGWSFDEAHRVVDLLDRVPGRVASVARALDDALSPATMDALVRLPPSVPGVVEGTYRGIGQGLRRPWAPPSTHASPIGLAIDFPASRARHFATTLARVAASFDPDPGASTERLALGKRTSFRVMLDGSAASTLRPEVHWLRGRLERLRGVRVWINGWRFEAGGPWSPSAQDLLIDAWFEGRSR